MKHLLAFLFSAFFCANSIAQGLQLNVQLTADLLVVSTENVTNGNGVTCCRFNCVYQGEVMRADFTPDDEVSDASVIEAVGTGAVFASFLSLVRTTHRDQFQAWYTAHKAQQ